MAAAERVKEIEKQLSLEATLDHEQRDITFIEFANQLIEHEKLYKEPNTIISYETAIKNFTDLHNLPLKSITNMHVQKCVDKLAVSGHKLSTIKKYTSLIKYIFGQAVKPNKVISINPIDEMHYPSETLEEQSKKIKALTRGELELLLSKLEERKTNTYIICLTAVTTGLRIGELLGLTWNDVDFKTGLLTVNKQWKRLKNGSDGFGKLKKQNSYRTVPIPQTTLRALLDYKETQTVTDINNRVFPFKSGYNKTINAFISRLGFNASIHDLRHTYATNLIASGVDFKTAAQLLGHDVEMTMRTYSHVTDDMLKVAAEKINKIF